MQRRVGTLQRKVDARRPALLGERHPTEATEAATRILLLLAILERISERVEGEAEEGMKTRLCQAIQGRGVFVCFGCAAPVIVRRGDKETG